MTFRLKTSRIRFVASVLACLALAAGSVFAADIYKIIDEDGNVTYSSMPPGSGSAEAVIPAVEPPSDAGYEAARQRQQDIREFLESRDQARLAQLELAYRAQASRPATMVQSNTTFMSVPTYLPRTRYRSRYSGSRGGSSIGGGHWGRGSVGTPPMRNQWGHTISHSWD